MAAKDVDDRIRFGSLYETYGALLTEKQRQCLELYFCEDFSLAEMPLSLADLTKQAVVKNTPDGAGLYRYPSETGKPIAVLREGETADIVRLEYSDKWMIVYREGEVYYARSAVFE